MKKSIPIILIIVMIAIGIFIFVKNDKENTKNNYEIITDKNIVNEFIRNSKEQKYEVIEKDSYYYVVINYGEQSSYYSKLEVTNVEINGKNINVTVKLPDGEGIGDAFSYPQAVIKFDSKPEKISVNYK